MNFLNPVVHASLQQNAAAITSRTVKPYRALVNLRPQLLIVIIANFLSHYPSFMAGIYSSAHTRTFCYSRKFVPAPFASLPRSHLDGLQNIPVSVLS